LFLTGREGDIIEFRNYNDNSHNLRHTPFWIDNESITKQHYDTIEWLYLKIKGIIIVSEGIDLGFPFKTNYI